MRAYLDHAATTGMLECARIAMSEQFARCGNPSSLHADGRAARRVVEESRERLAAVLGVGPNEVIFTSGGTEADNLAIKGLWWSRTGQDRSRDRVLVGATEHHAVLDPVGWLDREQGARASLVPVDPAGRPMPTALEQELAQDPGSVALVAVMWANNEVGTVAPIAEIAELCASHAIPLHVDAVQAFGAIAIDAALPTTLAISAHKFGGPPGAGALVVSRTAKPAALHHGGGQERGMRAGTLNVPAIAGMAAAAEHAVAHLEERAARLGLLREALVAGVLEAVPDAVVTGPAPGGSAEGPVRLPGIAHFCVPGARGETLLMLLDAAGISVSTGAACNAGVAEPSHVLTAMGMPDELVRSAMRVSLGHSSSAADIQALLAALPDAVARARRAESGRTRILPTRPIAEVVG